MLLIPKKEWDSYMSVNREKTTFRGFAPRRFGNPLYFDVRRAQYGDEENQEAGGPNVRHLRRSYLGSSRRLTNYNH